MAHPLLEPVGPPALHDEVQEEQGVLVGGGGGALHVLGDRPVHLHLEPGGKLGELWLHTQKKSDIKMCLNQTLKFTNKWRP